MFPKDITYLIECFKKFPGVGEKSAERMAMQVLDLDQEEVDLFSESIKNAKKNTKSCLTCNSLTDADTCLICTDDNRDSNIICVVKEPKNVIQFEKVGTYNGKYHVLGGLISPLDDINPEDLTIDLLLKRIEKENIKEIIIAVKPSIEGETTVLYLTKLLEKTNVIVSKIAHGIPIGAEIDYVDALTLELAIDDRIKISKENN